MLAPFSDRRMATKRQTDDILRSRLQRRSSTLIIQELLEKLG